MRLNGTPDLVNAYIRVMMLSEIGEEALRRLPDATLNLVQVFGSEPTLYYSKDTAIQINVDTLGARDPEEQCAVLCHETFHFIHHTNNRDAYRFRLTVGGRHGFASSNREEELAITGECEGVENNADGWNHKLFNENAVLRDRGLPPRASHDHGTAVAEQAAMVLRVSTAVDIPVAAPKRKPPPGLAERLSQKGAAKR